MSKPNSDPAAEAIGKVVEALSPLELEQKRRVLAAAAALFSISVGEKEHFAEKGEGAEKSTGSREVDHKGKSQSINELMLEKKPVTHAQRLAVFAFYRERVEGTSRFARSDLEDYYRKAKEAPPGNFDRDFTNAVKAGWIHEDGADSYLTSRGVEAVEAGFGKASPRGLSAVKAKRKSKR
jgi:hypothetical protein